MCFISMRWNQVIVNTIIQIQNFWPFHHSLHKPLRCGMACMIPRLHVHQPHSWVVWLDLWTIAISAVPIYFIWKSDRNCDLIAFDSFRVRVENSAPSWKEITRFCDVSTFVNLNITKRWRKVLSRQVIPHKNKQSIKQMLKWVIARGKEKLYRLETEHFLSFFLSFHI